MKKIVFRTMGGGHIGYGHYYRCISLAHALNYLGNVKLVFIINKELEKNIVALGLDYIVSNDLNEDITLIKHISPDIVVFDSYLSNNIYLEKLIELSRLAIFDDNNDIYDSMIPDIIINGNIHADYLQYKKRVDGIYLLGTNFLVMKQEYWNILEKSNNEPDKGTFDIINDGFNILITTGGSDKHGISLKIVKSLLNSNYEKKIVVGPSYEDNLITKLKKIEKENSAVKLIHKTDSLKKYIKASDIVITAGGSTVYEVLSQKKFPIIFSLADNQDMICSKLQDKGISYIGKYPDIKYANLLDEIDKVHDLDNNKLKGFNFHIFIDGNGALRIADRILKLL